MVYGNVSRQLPVYCVEKLTLIIFRRNSGVLNPLLGSRSSILRRSVRSFFPQSQTAGEKPTFSTQ